MKKLLCLLYILFHPKSWRLYREFKRYPETSPKNTLDPYRCWKATHEKKKKAFKDFYRGPFDKFKELEKKDESQG